MEKEKDSVRPSEKVAVFTTIVGGRPPGSGTDVGRIPRGIEVLIKKASVDEGFRAILLARRGEAAQEIGLELADAEEAMLRNIPAAQLEAIIRQTKVNPQNRRVFLGKVASAMLAAIVIGATGCKKEPPVTDGIRPDRPPEKSSEEKTEMKVSAGILVDSEPNQPVRPTYSRGIMPDRPGSKKQ